jgi:hypothetical protein
MLSRIPLDFPEHFIAIRTRMGIASPCVYRDSLALHSGFDDGLAKRKEGFGRMSAQFNEE